MASTMASRGYDPDWVAQQIGNLLQAIYEELLKYWQEQVIGIARFLAPAAALNGLSQTARSPGAKDGA